MNARDPLLDMLRREFGDRWSIRRTDSLLIATAHDPDPPHARTLVEPLERISAFVEDMADPPKRFARSLLDMPAFRDGLEEIGPGVYWEEKPR